VAAPARGSLTGDPSIDMRPPLRGIRPSTQRRSVVLPQPDGPTKATISRWPISRLMSRKTSSASYRLAAACTEIRAAAAPAIGLPASGARPITRLRVCRVTEPLSCSPSNREGISIWPRPPRSQILVITLGQPLLWRSDRALIAAILALHRARDVTPAELLDAVVAHALAEYGLPGIGEGPECRGHVGANRLALRPRRSLAPAALE